jgi:hypothetical protein
MVAQCRELHRGIYERLLGDIVCIVGIAQSLKRER